MADHVKDAEAEFDAAPDARALEAEFDSAPDAKPAKAVEPAKSLADAFIGMGQKLVPPPKGTDVNPVPPPELPPGAPSEGRAAVIGFAQGGTKKFSDEIGRLIGDYIQSLVPGQGVHPGPNASPEMVAQRLEQIPFHGEKSLGALTQKGMRKELDAAHEAYPGIMFGTELAGELASDAAAAPLLGANPASIPYQTAAGFVSGVGASDEPGTKAIPAGVMSGAMNAGTAGLLRFGGGLVREGGEAVTNRLLGPAREEAGKPIKAAQEALASANKQGENAVFQKLNTENTADVARATQRQRDLLEALESARTKNAADAAKAGRQAEALRLREVRSTNRTGSKAWDSFIGKRKEEAAGAIRKGVSQNMTAADRLRERIQNLIAEGEQIEASKLGSVGREAQLLQDATHSSGDVLRKSTLATPEALAKLEQLEADRARVLQERLTDPVASNPVAAAEQKYAPKTALNQQRLKAALATPAPSPNVENVVDELRRIKALDPKDVDAVAKAIIERRRAEGLPVPPEVKPFNPEQIRAEAQKLQADPNFVPLRNPELAARLKHNPDLPAVFPAAEAPIPPRLDEESIRRQAVQLTSPKYVAEELNQPALAEKMRPEAHPDLNKTVPSDDELAQKLPVFGKARTAARAIGTPVRPLAGLGRLLADPAGALDPKRAFSNSQERYALAKLQTRLGRFLEDGAPSAVGAVERASATGPVSEWTDEQRAAFMKYLSEGKGR